MRIFRKILVVGALSLLLVLALGIGAAGAALYYTFGSGKSVVAQGPQISTGSADPCSVILIDLEQVYVNLPEQLTLLPNPREIIRISTVPETDLVAGLLDRESVDTVILGFGGARPRSGHAGLPAGGRRRAARGERRAPALA